MMSDILGKLQYTEKLAEDGGLEQAQLFYVDIPPKEGSQWYITWVAQVEDYGNGMEVYFEPTSGGMPATEVMLATDENLKSTFETFKKQANFESEKARWKEVIESGEYEGLDASDADRLKELAKLI